METLPAGASLPFEYTAEDSNTGLNVAMKTYDTSSGSPVFVSTVAMVHVVNGTYLGYFTPVLGKTYLVNKTVYTDNTYTALLGGYSGKSETFKALNLSTYVNRISTTVKTNGDQELITWAERDGQSVVGTSCTVTIKDSAGVTKWTANLSTPNSDGVFKFTNPLVAAVNSNYYIVISITVDGAVRTSQQPFFTVG